MELVPVSKYLHASCRPSGSWRIRRIRFLGDSTGCLLAEKGRRWPRLQWYVSNLLPSRFFPLFLLIITASSHKKMVDRAIWLPMSSRSRHTSSCGLAVRGHEDIEHGPGLDLDGPHCTNADWDLLLLAGAYVL